MLGVVGSSLEMVKFGPKTPKAMSQHGGQTHATCCVKQCCVDMLRSFGRGLKASHVLEHSYVCLNISDVLEKSGGLTLTGNLDIKDSRNIIKVSDPFYKEILEIWLEANYEEKILSDYQFRSSPL